VIPETPGITSHIVQEFDHQSTDHVFIFQLRSKCACHNVPCVDKKDMFFLFPYGIHVMAGGFHAPYPFIAVLGLDFKWFIDPMRVVRMEENDGFRKERRDCEEQNDENINAGFEAVHKEAYSTDKKIMSNELIILVAHS
jgi:hypothetical protein